MNTDAERTELTHATTVELSGVALLLRGPAGAGKSDLALRLIDRGARLVADDQTVLVLRRGQVWASAPAEIAGRIEARGLGIARVPTVGEARVALIVDLVDTGTLERLPAPDTGRCLGVALPRIAAAPFEASAPAKLRLAARLVSRGLLPGHETAEGR